MSKQERARFHFCFMNWSKWDARKEFHGSRLPRLGEESAITGGAPIQFTHQYQERRCLVCSKEQVRFV